MSDYGTVSESGTVRFERLLPGSVERVWSYLTDSELRGRWLASGPMQLRPGGTVELRFRHSDLSPVKEPIPDRYKHMENGVTMRGSVTRCEPPRLLSMTWGGEPGGELEVTFELTQREANVLLVLTHRRITDHDAMVKTSGGWHTHLAILADNMSATEPRPFWSTYERIEREYERRIPA